MTQRTIACPTTFETSRQAIAGVSILDLAQQYGTPTYVYDMAVIEQRVADLATFGTIRYAQKACSNIAILDRLRKLGVVVDAVSAGEIGRAMRAGYVANSHPAGIVYTADVFDKAALDLVVQHNIPVNIGSPDMINQLGKWHRDATSRCESTRALVTGTVRKPIRAVRSPSTVFGTNKSMTACDAPIDMA